MLTDSRQGSRHQLGTESVETRKAVGAQTTISFLQCGHSWDDPSVTRTQTHGFMADLTFEVWIPFIQGVLKRNKDIDDPPNEMSLKSG